MSRFILKTIYTIILTVLISAMILLFMAIMPCKASQYSHEANVHFSIERLESLRDSAKIVIVGGSNCGFGFKSQLLYDKFKMPVVNTGTHGNLGLRLQLALVKDFINEGDCVIVCPEYQQFEHRFYGGFHAITILSSVYKQGFRLLNLKQAFFLFPQIPAHFIYVVEKGKWIPPKESPYSIYSLNQFGDVTAYSQRNHKDFSADSVISDYSQDARKELIRFKSFCVERGATFVLLPPTYQDSSFEINKNYISLVMRDLENHAIPFQADPQRYRFADTLYFDTVYHMTEKGSEIRTERVIEDIAPFIKRFSSE